ncbi:MAG: TRAP transporter small permease subunit [Tagaea sp.]
MGALESYIRIVEKFNRAFGMAISVMTFGTAIVCFSTVFLRYALNTSYTWLTEAYIWQHLLVIMLGAGYTFLVGGFVRVDVFYARMTPKGKALVDLIGTFVFLGPFLYFAAKYSWVFVAQSWALLERSPQADGLPGLYLLKTAMLVCYALVGLQGLALAARSALVLGGRPQFAPVSGGH